jgi:hypothetical protein
MPDPHLVGHAADHQRDARQHRHAEQQLARLEAGPRDPGFDQAG